MFCKFVLTLVNVACLISVGYSFTGNLEVPFIHDDIDVLVGVVVGTPNDGKEPQKLRALFDTGSDNMWVVKEENTYTAITGSMPFYSGRSSTFTELRQHFSGNYGEALITGSLGSDNVQIGEGNNAIVLEGKQFGLASEIPSIAFGALFDNHEAVIGMNLVSEVAPDQPEPLLQTMHRKFQRMPIIGFYINSKYNQLSKMTFDVNDVDLVDGRLNTHDVVKVDGKYNGWNVNVAKFALRMKDGSVKTTKLPEGKYAQIISRKNPVIIGPADIIGTLNAEIFKTANFEYDNDYTFKLKDGQKLEDMLRPLPDVSLYIDNVEYVFKPDQYIRLRQDNKYRTCLVSGAGDKLVLGLGFMFHYYTKFDYENKKVHIGRAKIEVNSADLKR